MKSLAVALTVVAAFIVAGFAPADDAEQSDELQVLNRFVGTWQMKTTLTPAQGDPIENEGTEARRMSQGGQVLMFENAGQPEFQMLLMSDPASDDYVGVMLTSGASATMTAEWNAESDIMTFHGTFTNGFSYD